MDYTFEMDDPYDGKAFALDGEGEHYKIIISTDPTEAADDPTADDPPTNGG